MNESKVDVVIVNELGLHARAAAVFVKEANKFDSEIIVIKDGIKAEGKSIMSLMMLAAPKGSTLEIIAIGDDSAEATKVLKLLVENKFGEDK
jgi:phosphocarrier protein